MTTAPSKPQTHRVISSDCREVVRLQPNDRVLIPEKRLGRKRRYEIPTNCEFRHIGDRVLQVVRIGEEPTPPDLDNLPGILLTKAERNQRMELQRNKPSKRQVPEGKRIEVSQGKRLHRMASHTARMTFVRAICEKDVRQKLARELGIAWVHSQKPHIAAKLEARKPTDDQVRFRMEQLMVIARYYFPDIETKMPD